MNTSQDIPEEMHSDSVGSKTVHSGGSIVFEYRWDDLFQEEITRSKEKIDKAMDIGVVNDCTVLRRIELKNNLLKLTKMEAKYRIHKSKVKWALEGDENSKFFHVKLEYWLTEATLKNSIATVVSNSRYGFDCAPVLLLVVLLHNHLNVIHIIKIGHDTTTLITHVYWF
nr:hypothetical protein [Tanacetum cinerariifolium]